MTDRSIITVLSDTVEINDVQNVAVTDIITDVDGSFVRSLRIYGLPNGIAGRPIVEIIIRSVDKAPLLVMTPTLSF